MDNIDNIYSGKLTHIIPPSLGQLVDRQEHLAKFSDVLDRVARQGPLSSNLFEWYGCPGIGKSMLTYMLAARSTEKHAVYTIVNFKQSIEKTNEYFHDPTILIEEIISGLARQTSLNTQEFDTAIKEYRNTTLPEEGVVSAYSVMDQETRLYRHPSWLTELRNTAIAFFKLINLMPMQAKANGICPVVLFFDETEYADIELIDWIEEWVVGPILQIQHCVVVWTTRRPWRWKRPEIRRRLSSQGLNSFQPETVKEQIQFRSANADSALELYRSVHTLTGGHPFASSIVISEVDALTRLGEKVTSENFHDFEPKLLEEVFDRFVYQYAFSELESNDLKIACKFISLVRLFDLTMIRRILQACAGDLFSSWIQDDFGDLLLKLKKTQLLVWEKGHAIDPGLRYIIQKYFMVVDQNSFIKANRAALEIYEDWLGRPVDNRSLFVLEELYHNAALQQVGEGVDLHELLSKRLQEYPNWIRDEKALENALERLEGEIANDEDLEKYTHSNSQLVEQVQKFRLTRIKKESTPRSKRV